MLSTILGNGCILLTFSTKSANVKYRILQKMPYEKPTYVKMHESEVPNAYVGMSVDTSDWTNQERDRYDARLHEQDKQAQEQTAAEKTYTNDTPVLGADFEPSVEQVVSMLELGHVVKEAPKFETQVTDETRTNTVVVVTGQKKYIATRGFEQKYGDSRVELTEHELLETADQFFQDMTTAEIQRHRDYLDEKRNDEEYIQYLKEYPEEAVDEEEMGTTLGEDMREHLTYIGEKELVEAAAGLAEYWKAILDTNPDQQIFVAVGAFIKAEAQRVPEVAHRVKSDKFIFDKIMEHFSEEEMKLYKDRLITEPSEVTIQNPKDLRIILVDDWSISRKQMSESASYIRSELPQFTSCIEVNLIAATEVQIQFGLARSRSDALPGMASIPLPVRAYYKAHMAEISQGGNGNGAHITGTHSAVDYNFAELVEPELEGLWFHAEHSDRKLPDTLRSMPPIMNIVRPYRPVGSNEDKPQKVFK